ncbi:CmcJ/NvfI family oxidoreductase [Novosphingobium bradum]|uniref:CmcJ/NvfI family oxidoreductase n=1 Tax=Novosphingobium bradum TaxID=1737444 RepID=A0ABV7IV79_9SPHN
MSHAADLIADSLVAPINFASPRMREVETFVVSNFEPEKTTLVVEEQAVPIRDARLLAPAASYQREGFELHHVPVENPRWTDDAWIQSSYLPVLRDLALRITGGAEAVTFPGSWVIRDTAGNGAAPAAAFAHMDRERESCREIIRNNVDEAIRTRYPRFEMINFWRALSPPPHDVPLAICDQRTIAPGDWLVGETREPNMRFQVKHMAAVYNPDNRWYYYSSLSPDELIAFKNHDDDPARLPGCLHGAFRDPTVHGGVPRVSLETRFYVFHES